jgi:hypothetical protein
MPKKTTPPTEHDDSISRNAAAPTRFVPFDEATPRESFGLGADAGGQAGDTAGLSRDELEGPESVEELVEEGQAYEASVISGVEDTPDADRGPVTTHQVPEDDVPAEYLPERDES